MEISIENISIFVIFVCALYLGLEYGLYFLYTILFVITVSLYVYSAYFDEVDIQTDNMSIKPKKNSRPKF